MKNTVRHKMKQLFWAYGLSYRNLIAKLLTKNKGYGAKLK